MNDAFDLHAAMIHNSPLVADWNITRNITRLNMDPRGGVQFIFDASLPESWKWMTGNGSDNFQFTAWAFVRLNGIWHGAGFVQMWQGRSMTDGSLPPILSGYKNWWGDVRHLWAEMSDYVPHPDEPIGFMATAGNARLMRPDAVTSVAERTNVVIVPLPPGDSGSFTFQSTPSQPNQPAPPSTPPTPDTQALLDKLQETNQRLLALEAKIDAALAKAPPTYRGAVPYLGPLVLKPE